MGSDDPTAILTKGQREYLSGAREPAQERTMRTRIRDRFRQAFDDLQLLLEAGAGEERLDLEAVLTDVDAGRVWPLPALLFVWSEQHPMLADRDDLVEVVAAASEDVSPQEEMDRVTASFDSQVESGVHAALEFGDSDLVPAEVGNELTVSLGGPVSDMSEEKLAELPRRRLDLLFRRGDLDNQEYARVMQLKLETEAGDADE